MFLAPWEDLPRYAAGPTLVRLHEIMEYKRVHIVGEGLVVAFDMCSSSTVLEELTLCGDLARYSKLLQFVKEYLAKAQKTVLFDPYKFTGDGWILLFPKNTDGELLFHFLRDFCVFFEKEFAIQVLRHLGTPPALTGLTFGIDKGPFIGTTMYGQQEYFGRALNVACRLSIISALSVDSHLKQGWLPCGSWLQSFTDNTFPNW
jgi:hypothetical protein